MNKLGCAREESRRVLRYFSGRVETVDVGRCVFRLVHAKFKSVRSEATERDTPPSH